MSNGLAVIVPFRDRETHLAQFLPCIQTHLDGMAQPFKMFVVHQVDGKTFNRGAMKNVGFELARREGFRWMAFHDVDCLPEGPTCDYSMPQDKPVHLAAQISHWDYRQIYITSFGGVVIFNVPQFIRVNGYSNDYWGWGGEDDDLFSRMVRVGFAERSEIPSPEREVGFARFNGEGAMALVRDIPLGLMEGSSTLDLLVRPRLREDLEGLPPNLQFTKQFPLLYRHGFPIMVHSRMHFMGVHVDDRNSVTMPAVESGSFFESNPQGWEHVTMVVDREAGECRLYSNGVGGESVYDCESIDRPGREWWGTPLVVGRQDTLVGEGPESWTWFKGDIARVSMWGHALRTNEIRAYIGGGGPKPLSVQRMGDGVEGRNLTYGKEMVGPFCGPFVPFRRGGRFRNIDLRDRDERFEEPEVSDNLLKSYKVRCGEVDPYGGLDTLNFHEIGRRTLPGGHIMVDVELLNHQ